MVEEMWKHGWPSHFLAMQRWKDRALENADVKVTKTVDGFMINSSESFDHAYAFFIWAHSMRDWLIKTRAIERKKLDEKLGNFKEWGMVRDLSNRVKHQKISQNPVDAEWIAGMKGSGNANPPARLKIEPYILHGGNYQKLDVCITEIWEMWIEVLTKAQLVEIMEDGELRCID